jgi:hypothetical protein
MVLVNSRPEALGCPSQASDEFSGIDRAARNVFRNSQSAGIVPRNRRIGAATLARDFPCAATVEIAIHFQRAKNFLETGEDVAETRHIAGGSFRERHAAGAAACARAYSECFENGNGFLRREPLEPRGCGKPGEPTADDGKIDG